MNRVLVAAKAATIGASRRSQVGTRGGAKPEECEAGRDLNATRARGAAKVRCEHEKRGEARCRTGYGRRPAEGEGAREVTTSGGGRAGGQQEGKERE